MTIFSMIVHLPLPLPRQSLLPEGVLLQSQDQIHVFPEKKIIVNCYRQDCYLKNKQ